MPMPTGATIGILADNLKKRNSVLPISAAGAVKWARGLDLPRGGETVIYTGIMYQLIPYIAAMSKAQGKVEDSWLADFVSLGRYVNKVVNISAFMAMPPGSVKENYNRMLANIALLLKRAGAEFGYLYGDELYSGALAYDLGADDIFEDHARKVYGVFKKYGVKNVITVDPHTTNMLRQVYPEIIKGYDLNVKSYMEVLVEKKIEPVRETGGEVVLHDSCIYARYENLLSEQRALLSGAGITVKEPRDSGKFTMCCGGPAESLYPKKAVQQAARRVEQLRSAGGRVATMCPLCYVNLQKVSASGLVVEDVSSHFVRAYLP